MTPIPPDIENAVEEIAILALTAYWTEKFLRSPSGNTLISRAKQFLLSSDLLRELMKDKERLEAIVENEWFISWSSDGEGCNVWKQADRDGEAEPVEGYPQKMYYDWRTAIDAAMSPDSVKQGEKI